MNNTQGVQYNIKLYGHTSEDSDRFTRDLAVLLAIDEAGARELLVNVPVIIARTPSKEQAEHFVQRMALIRGLCLVEAEEGGQPVAAPVEADSTSPLAEAPDEDLEERQKKESFLSYVWLSALVAVSGIALVAGLVVFAVQWWRTSVAHQPEPVPTLVESPQPQQAEGAVSVAVQREVLRQKIERLRSEVKDLKFQASWQAEELNKLYKRRPLPYDDIQRMKVQIARTEDRIRSAEKEIRRSSDKLPKQ